jgi:hypothetical protein
VADPWSLRIAGARDAQTRTRWAFLASTVISVALIIAIFNFEFSWLRNFALKKEFPSTAMQTEIQKDLMKSWIDSGRLKISVLGVDIGGSDATIMGSLISIS